MKLAMDIAVGLIFAALALLLFIAASVFCAIRQGAKSDMEDGR